MKLDNSRSIISLRIKLFAATLLFLTYIVLTYVAKMIRFPLFGLSDAAWTVILVVIYLFFVFYPMFFNYQYISYSDDDDKIIFRYFTSGIFGGRKNSVEIDKRTFAGFKTESKLLGMIMSITLFQQFKEGIAKYPPIYISALKKEERGKVIRSLNLYAPKA